MSKIPSELSKAKMLPSHEIYNRIIWDNRLNPKVFTFGYVDRLTTAGIKEIALVDWDANGDIPWHRIRYIRCLNTIVWDRDQHIDFFSSDELPDEAWKSKQIQTETLSDLSLPIFSPQPIYQCNLVGWQSFHQARENTLINGLRIVTFNVLSDMYEADKIYSSERIPVIIEHLKNSLADIIVLQEVTKPLFNQLLKESWVKEYFSSEAPEAPSLQPQNLVIFSKFPFTLVDHWYSTYKRVLVASWQINDQPLHLAAVHLTSNRANNSEQVRASQLSSLLKYLASLAGDSIISGDFNLVDSEHDQDLLEYGFHDIWKSLRPKDVGYTFNPEINPLAKIMSLQGRQARFDRVLLRSKTGNWQAQTIEMFANEPFDKAENRFASDHFGLQATLTSKKVNLLQTIQPVYQSAIVIIPPKELWPSIQSIRKLYDKKIDRWMPHITLIYGFIPEEHFKEASKLILQALSLLQPFTITLTGFKTFTHRKSATAWLEPVTSPNNLLTLLQSTLQKLFPECNEQTSRSSGFTPHLSVGQFDSPLLALKLLPEWQKVEFQVNSVALISRRADKPFEIRYEVPIGKNQASINKALSTSETWQESLISTLDKLSPSITKEQKSQQEVVLSIIKEACKECLAEEPSLYLIGSARLGVQNQNSDIDIVCIIPNNITGQEFLSQIKQRLSGIYEQARMVITAQVPILKLKIDGVSIDLLYASSSLFPFSIELNTSAQKYFDQTSWQTLVGCLEADILLNTVRQYVELEGFRQFLCAVRLWAKTKAILGNAWGFPGSFSWTILAAWSCDNLTNPKTTPAEMFVNFFNRLVKHNWNQPIALTESGRKYHISLPKDWLPIITSIKPNQNSARNICRSTAEVVKKEISLGAKLISQIQTGDLGWDTLFEIPKLNQSPKSLVIEVKAKNTNDLEACLGWLEGHIFGLMINLEQLNIGLRPWPMVKRQQTTGQVTLGIDTSLEKSDPKLIEVLKSFTRMFYSATTYPNNAHLDIEICLGEERPV